MTQFILSVNRQSSGVKSVLVMSRCFKKLIIKAIKRTHFIFPSRDYLLHPSPSPIKPAAAHLKDKIIGKNDDKANEKPEKKEKKIKEMSESRIKKFQKLFGQQVSAEEKLINYFSCALVAEILLQGHLYISENYFSFYSNVFGYVTKLVIPVITVTSISREKTAKFFPNAIALQLNDGKHVFGSFLSRETAYHLMSLIHRKNEQSIELTEDVDEGEPDEIDGAQAQDVEVSSLEDSSSISGSESPAQYKIPPIDVVEDAIEEEVAQQPPPNVPPRTNRHDIFVTPNKREPIEKVGSFNVKLMSEFNLLFVGICLTLLLAFFSGLLLLKINSLEKHNQPSDGLHDFDSTKFTIEDAESILNKNVLIVRNVRKKLEDLQEMLQTSFDKIPPTLNDKQEF